MLHHDEAYLRSRMARETRLSHSSADERAREAHAALAQAYRSRIERLEQAGETVIDDSFASGSAPKAVSL